MLRLLRRLLHPRSSSSSSSSSSIVRRFIDIVQKNELTVTDRGLQCLDKFRTLDFEGENMAKLILLEKLLNWDGRFPRHVTSDRMFDGTDGLLEDYSKSLLGKIRPKIIKAKEYLWPEEKEDIIIDDKPT